VGVELPDFLERPVDTAAELLLGCLIERTTEQGTMLVRIVETEAYDEADPASHAHRGPTARNAAMFGPSGHLYVYFTYGMHHCCNVVCAREGVGAGVLIRAAEPLVGAEQLELRRGVRGRGATNGPGKLCQALAIDRALCGHDLRRRPVRLLAGALRDDERVARTTRIGVTKAADRRRRFHIIDNEYVSRRAAR
jgi:DNA-3-methyladenine glycosylase